MIKNKVFLILSLFTIFSMFGAKEQVNETRHLKLAYVIPLSYQLNLKNNSSCGGSAEWSPDGKYIKISWQIDCGPNFGDVPTKILDAKTGNLIYAFSDSRALRFSPDGHYFAVAFAHRVEIYNTSSGECQKKIDEKLMPPIIWWLPDSKFLIIFEAVLFENYIRKFMMYDVLGDKISKFDWYMDHLKDGYDSYRDNYSKSMTNFSCAPNSQMFTTYNNNKVLLFNINSSAPIGSFYHEGCNSSYWSSDSKYLMTGSHDTVKLWNVINGKLLNTLDILAWYGQEGDGTGFFAKTFRDNELLIISKCGVISLYNLYTREIKIVGVHENASYAEWSSNRAYLVTVNSMAKSIDCCTKLWNIQTGELPGELQTAIHCSGRNISADYVATPSQGCQSLQLWDVHTGTLIQDEPVPTGDIYWSPDGKRLITRSYVCHDVYNEALGIRECQDEAFRVWDLV